MRFANPAGERNKDPILNVLKRVLSKTLPNLRLLEISSGVGLHAPYFAKEFPNITFQPSEFDTTLFGSIEAYRQGVENVRSPIFIDVSKPCQEWENDANINQQNSANHFDYMLNINMLHISPIACALGLFHNSSVLLKTGGLLITYGPYAVNGMLTPESNVQFNRSLRQRNPEWGIRDTSELREMAMQKGISLLEVIDLPANNKCIIWKKE
ncbi:methyltransferase-like 26 [Anopheles stephensi]|uniref:methyltransferase-like 26 n=1 Tax=Anopheles stephensi TaxID=30069 RepID=UPI00165873E5|nr:methyltransferase-like 26 [Anopheles stephensi]XP_035916913.1 methyltransferase-like 26 [Anopheles stephensi]